jgi:hypothetical protein
MTMRLVVPILLAVLSLGYSSTGVGAQSNIPQPTVTPTPGPITDPHVQEQAERAARKKLRARIRHDRSTAWYWQGVMLKPRTGKRRNLARISSLTTLRRHAQMWHGRKVRARYKAYHPPMLWAWRCIHRGEGSWKAATGNHYFGGLQMDWTFMSNYGPKLLASKGPANNWTPLEQIWVAVNAAFRHGRGFYPWPNTARACGLI